MGMGVGCRFLLQGIFLTQGLYAGLPHCSRMESLPLSLQGSLRTLDWAAISYSKLP